MNSVHNPKVSIIVPIYNAELYLNKCLDSLVNQTFEDIEIICINDGSVDGSKEIMVEYSNRDNRIKICEQKNSGVSAARNNGIDVAKGKYVMFVDSDDWIDEKMCEITFNIAEEERADVVKTSYIREYKNKSLKKDIFHSDYFVLNHSQIMKEIHRRLFGLLGNEMANPENADSIATVWNTLYRYDLISDKKFIDINDIGTFEDGLFQIHALESCRRFVYINQPLYHYRKTNVNSITTQHKPELFDKWQNLFNIMEDYIKVNNLGREYTDALNNRICMSMIGLGLNEITAKSKTIIEKSKRLRKILKTVRYQNAYNEFNFTYLPFKWKFFFGLCKYQLTTILVIMVYGIKFLKDKV
ncbi:glycosyltransferase [Halobacillus seohaensis]|uniref:Glycosyltransferase n=1 Tax=Halobacillus seohaensis TaxID=447421 RepID=A0ABW2ELP2_9BACI